MHHYEYKHTVATETQICTYIYKQPPHFGILPFSIVCICSDAAIVAYNTRMGSSSILHTKFSKPHLPQLLDLSSNLHLSKFVAVATLHTVEIQIHLRRNHL